VKGAGSSEPSCGPGSSNTAHGRDTLSISHESFRLFSTRRSEAFFFAAAQGVSHLSSHGDREPVKLDASMPARGQKKALP